MRILFTCRPAYGHLFPLLPLANAAVKAGHEVVFGTGEAFVPKVRDLGFTTHRAGIAISEAEAEAKKRHGEDAGFLDVGITMFGELLPKALLDDLTPLLPRLRPDLVVYEMSDVGTAIAARRAGIPAVSVVIGRSMPPEVLAVAAERLRPLWGTLPADALLGDACVDVWPDRVRDPGTAGVPKVFRMRPTPYDPDVPLPPLPADGFVYLTLGTVVFGATDVLRGAIRALDRLDVDVLVALGPGDPAALGPLPARVRATGFVPQARVLDHAGLVVHHGGSGTVLATLAAGLPQLVLPQGADQFANAETLEALGVAKALIGDAVRVPAIGAAARTLLEDPKPREIAEGIAAEIREMPSPEQVLGELVSWMG
ncbi:UDP:flavonoid glycosyltransferase YjiC (YdhE family) [Amycolatopsis lexingtonensis]|uniref:UDP:flavonoid glycosyltransferase YjiC (YdhE family) n=1 Tax=Amycolatopsis lexingtonensis TaxID=218822 RepID=A0ABR9I9T0_9PSEU|nr:glycosyltransferase [Amycolatopsis lexingtonensis]MBE1499952.1 UDP:flavonoid glycosyltransferase YjiC (YdhE family) [Amycolatopsis lexingtonensis]